jgi:hypothetical protein
MDDKLIKKWIKQEEMKDSLINYIDILKKKIIKIEEEMKEMKEILKNNNIK